MKNQDFDKLSPGIQRKGLKIMFFGTSEFATPALKSLLNFGYEVVAVVTQSEKPAGRLRVTMPSPIKKAALENHILVFEPHNLKSDEEFFKHFKHLNPDLCIVAAYGKIIPSRYLEIPKLGFLNIHPSLLPKYRGPSPIQAAILNGDKETGVSIMLVDAQMDHGPILKSGKWKVESGKYYKEIEKELAEEGARLLLETLPKYLNGEIGVKPQEHEKATITKLLTRQDGQVDWNKNAEEIYNQIRALSPEPGTWTTWKGKVLNIKIAESSVLQVNGQGLGVVVRINNDIAVATKTCYLILKQIQLEGGKEMDAKAFLNGHPDFLASKLD